VFSLQESLIRAWDFPLSSMEKQERVLLCYDKEEALAQRQVRTLERKSGCLQNQVASLCSEVASLQAINQHLQKENQRLNQRLLDTVAQMAARQAQRPPQLPTSPQAVPQQRPSQLPTSPQAVPQQRPSQVPTSPQAVPQQRPSQLPTSPQAVPQAVSQPLLSTPAPSPSQIPWPVPQAPVALQQPATPGRMPTPASQPVSAAAATAAMAAAAAAAADRAAAAVEPLEAAMTPRAPGAVTPRSTGTAARVAWHGRGYVAWSQEPSEQGVPWVTFTSRTSCERWLYGAGAPPKGLCVGMGVEDGETECMLCLRRGEFVRSVSGCFGKPQLLAQYLRILTSEQQEASIGVRTATGSEDFHFEAKPGYEITGLKVGPDGRICGVREKAVAPRKSTGGLPAAPHPTAEQPRGGEAPLATGSGSAATSAGRLRRTTMTRIMEAYNEFDS